MNRTQYPQRDFDLQRAHGDTETWEDFYTDKKAREDMVKYETAYQLARIANALENMIENGLPVAGGAVSRGL